jgi:negative regulator of flagellin synthesis FlgM
MASGPINKPGSQSPSSAALLGTLAPGKAAGLGNAAVKEIKALGKNERKDGDYDVQISASGKGRAEAMQKAFEIAKATPNVREDRVAALKKQIDAGTYKVDSGAVADGMMREAIKDHLAETDER